MKIIEEVELNDRLRCIRVRTTVLLNGEKYNHVQEFTPPCMLGGAHPITGKLEIRSKELLKNVKQHGIRAILALMITEVKSESRTFRVLSDGLRKEVDDVEVYSD